MNRRDTLRSPSGITFRLPTSGHQKSTGPSSFVFAMLFNDAEGGLYVKHPVAIQERDYAGRRLCDPIFIRPFLKRLGKRQPIGEKHEVQPVILTG